MFRVKEKGKTHDHDPDMGYGVHHEQPVVAAAQPALFLLGMGTTGCANEHRLPVITAKTMTFSPFEHSAFVVAAGWTS